MPTTISRKICLCIVDKYVTSRQDLCALSATNKLLRDVTLPFLFSNLRFDGLSILKQYHSHEEITFEEVFQPLVEFYKRVHRRVEALKTCPHLQSYVTTLEIRGWSLLSSFLDEEPDMWQDPRYDIAEKHWKVAYDSLESFIRDLPSLETLAVIFSPITSKLQDALYLTRNLEGVVLYDCQMEDGPSSVRRKQVKTRLKYLKYDYDPRHSKMAPVLFRQLLSRSLSTLMTLTFSMECIVPIATLICRSSHTLKHLSITEVKVTPMDYTKGEALYDLLDSCPKLTTLCILGWMDDTLPYLEEHLPLGITCAAGTASLVRAVSSGRPVSSIHFKYCPLDPILPSTFILDQPSTARVRKVSLECSTALRTGILPALSAAFPFIDVLTIRFVRGYQGDRSTAIIDLWQPISTSLHHLQVYRVLDVYPPRSDMDKKVSKNNAECPVGRRNDPHQRRHPSLREIQLLSRYTWLWFSDAGWTCHEFPVESL